MKTLVKFNKANQSVEVTNFEIIERTNNQSIINYLKIEEKYQLFCKNQTKTGQARKNERARARNTMFVGVWSNEDYLELCALKQSIKAEKDALIEKVTVEITYDGRKSSNLSKIIEGVKMCYFVGGISPQYYGLGLINFEIK